MAVLVTLALVAVIAIISASLFLLKSSSKSGTEKQNSLVRAPGPKPWPVIGSLHLLGQHKSPFQAFTALSKVYGDVYSITLGSTPCVVVNSLSLMKDVLVTKASHFGGRPDFIRFHLLFGGDRNNSHALCDWSDLQQTRRNIALAYCWPRSASDHFATLDAVSCNEVGEFLGELKRQTSLNGHIAVKPLLQATVANMFTQYMCSVRFDYHDDDFRHMVRTFDEIFWDINQGYAVDFLPWLLPAYRGHMKKLKNWSLDIRQFILSRIVEPHRRTLNLDGEPRDFTDALLMHLEKDPILNWEHILYELEDFMGAHSSIGNLVMLCLAAAVKNPEVAVNVQREVDAVTGGSRNVTLYDKDEMPYTDAVMLEALRTSSSPIVPHVATQDTSIGGYMVEKGTVVFINNYELNSGAAYWTEPEAFRPERFISPDGKVTKPEHFIPFSTGKRYCIGQRLVKNFTFILLAAIFQHYNVTSKNHNELTTIPACVALPPDTFSLVFTPRTV